MYFPTKRDVARWKDIWRTLLYRVILDRRQFTWESRMTLRGWLRTWAAPDITLLGWPGLRFWHAHLRHRVLYGDADWHHFKVFAEKRHQDWIAAEDPIELKLGHRRNLYVEGPRGRA